MTAHIPLSAVREMSQMAQQTEGAGGKAFQHATVALGFVVAASMAATVLMQLWKELNHRDRHERGR